MLPEKAILEFREIYKEEFSEELTLGQATEKAVLVFNLFKVLVYGDKALTDDAEKEHYEN